MNIDTEIARASRIMHRYHVLNADQVEVIKILIDAGVERCLQEQERLRRDKNAMIAQAQDGRAN